jgi:hypothetical protein
LNFNILLKSNIIKMKETTDHFTDTLPIPPTDDPNDGSASPSPTHDMIKGAGTTPILPVPPDLGFGEDSGIDENSISRGNSPSPAPVISAPPPSGENSPFGPSFEVSPFATSFGGASDHVKLPPPARPPPPPHESSIAAPPGRPPPPSASANGRTCVASDTGFTAEQTEFGESSGAPPPRPPAPSAAPNAQFVAFDANQQQYIIQQQIMFQQQQALAAQQQQQQSVKKKPASAFEDLDIAMRQTMAKPQQPVGQPAPQASQGSVFVPAGGVVPAGYVVVPSYGVPSGAGYH